MNALTNPVSGSGHQLLNRGKSGSREKELPAEKWGSEDRSSGRDVQQFIADRDFTGAIALMEHRKRVAGDQGPHQNDLWLAYCHFHLQDWQSAMQSFARLVELAPIDVTVSTAAPETGEKPEKRTDEKKEKKEGKTGRQLLASVFGQSSSGLKNKWTEEKAVRTWTADELRLCVAVCLFAESRDSEAQDVIQSLSPGFQSPLRTRVQCLLMAKTGQSVDDKLMSEWKSSAQVSDGMCASAVHYLRSEFQDCISLYQKLQQENSDTSGHQLLALNVYTAICYYRLEYYDVAHELLTAYRRHHPDSAVAANVSACCHFRLWHNATAAEKQLRLLIDWDAGSGRALVHRLIAHNVTIFCLSRDLDSESEAGLQSLTKLTDSVPEARLNAAICHLRRAEHALAFQMVNDLRPGNANEFLVSAVVFAVVGQEQGNKKLLQKAQQYFETVGSSPAECDTIPGRECMACAFFLMGQLSDVVLYLSSISSYFFPPEDQTYCWNMGQAKAGTGAWSEGAELLLQVKGLPQRVSSRAFAVCLIRCLVLSSRAEQALTLVSDFEPGIRSHVLHLLANDCYRTGQFLTAMTAFHLIAQQERHQQQALDSSNGELWEGIRGSAAGHFQAVVAGRAAQHTLTPLLTLLSHYSQQPHAVLIADVVRRSIRQQEEDRIS